MRVWVLASLLAVATVASVGPASAGCRSEVDADNPMVTDEDYGITRCGDRSDDDPMVWQGDRWQSSLFGGYANDERDRPAHVVVHVQQTMITTAPASADAQPARKRARLINTRTGLERAAGRGVLRFDGRNCRGALVLTWGPLGSKISCHERGGKLRTIR